MASPWVTTISQGDGGGGASAFGVPGASGLANTWGAMSSGIPATVSFPYSNAVPGGGASAAGFDKSWASPAPVNAGVGATGGGGYGGGGSYGLASTGGGGSVGGGALVQNDLTSPWTGFASRYMPGSAEMLFANPEIMLRDTLRDMGRLPDQGLYYMLEPMARNANALFALGYGTGSDLGAGSQEAGINFTNEFLRNYATPGGEAVDYNAGMNSMMNYEPGSALDSMLNLATPEDQVSNFRGLASALAATSLHPLMARAADSFNEARGIDFMSSVARGDAQSNFGNYLASRQGPYQTYAG